MGSYVPDWIRDPDRGHPGRALENEHTATRRCRLDGHRPADRDRLRRDDRGLGQRHEGVDRGGPHVSGLRVVGIVLLIAGILAVAYGGFSYTKDSTVAKVGPIEIEAKEKEHVNVPL